MSGDPAEPLLLLEYESDEVVRHGPSHVLSWRQARYSLENSTIECEVVSLEDAVEKRFRFDDLEVAVRELPPTVTDSTGLGVWDASIALAAIAAQRRPRCSCLELGCGIALPSKTLAALGTSRILATDGSQTIVERLDIPAKVLDWSDSELTDSFDLVLGAEIVYSTTALLPLARVLRHCARDQVWLVGLARRRPLLEKLCTDLLKDDFLFQSKTVTLTATTSDPGIDRVTVDDRSRVDLLFFEGRRTSQKIVEPTTT